MKRTARQTTPTSGGTRPRRPGEPRAERGLSFIEVTISASIVSMIFYTALTGYTGTMRGSTAGTARLEAMANSAGALTSMNLELQEASVRDETVEIYWIDPDTSTISGLPMAAAAVPPPDTIYPSDNVVGDDSFALRFMTVGDFTTLGDSITIEQSGPYLYRLGTGAATDFSIDKLIRVDESGVEAPRVLCRGVQQVVFRRDSRGGTILISLTTSGRDQTTGALIPITQVVTITPKNDFSANLSNFDLNGEEF